MNETGLIIEGVLLVLGPEPTLPGDTLSISVSKFQVDKVISGRYEGTSILVGHSYDERMSLEEHMRYRLNLTREFPEHATLLNPFQAEEPRLPVYYCISLMRLA